MLWKQVLLFNKLKMIDLILVSLSPVDKHFYVGLFSMYYIAVADKLIAYSILLMLIFKGCTVSFNSIYFLFSGGSNYS